MKSKIEMFFFLENPPKIKIFFFISSQNHTLKSGKQQILILVRNRETSQTISDVMGT